ncbi:uncharacterized protein LOC134242075 [Saccostrea cucullata]|uniref:uncharacterized protein LOC134242075 n=1 Tax=Saccostrea cuccullata TaxID=36930 RepID=UPI002ED02029
MTRISNAEPQKKFRWWKKAKEGDNYLPSYHLLHGVCPKSTETIKYVPGCPTTEEAWKEREEQKRCEDVEQDCVTKERFVYHCAVNEWRNVTLEVCAPLRIIFGRCVEYNVLGKRIQFNRERCTTFWKPCPEHYQSNDVYLYPECFKTIMTYTSHLINHRHEKHKNDRQREIKVKEVQLVEFSEGNINSKEDTNRTNNGERKYTDLSLLSLNVLTALLLTRWCEMDKL